MIKIIDVDSFGSTSVLFLDSETPRENWNRIMISGKTYEPIPVYDMEKTVAIKGNGFFAGQEVTFSYE